jgi:uncharacterized protein YndB with AHSA1/START domain
MQVFKITVKIPQTVEEVFKYITTPENFPRWKKDVWISGRKFGEMGPGFKMIQTIHLMCPRKLTMVVTGYEPNKYFKFEALKGFTILPAWTFSFEPLGERTLLTVVSDINLAGASIRGILYPLGLAHHWKVYFELLSRELFSRPSMIQIVSFKHLNYEERVVIHDKPELDGLV